MRGKTHHCKLGIETRIDAKVECASAARCSHAARYGGCEFVWDAAVAG